MGRKPLGLTVAAIKALKPQAKPFEIKDDALMGAYVEMRPSGAVSYVLRYRFDHKTCKLTLGRFDPDEGGLSKARAKAREARNLLGQGVDPAATKREAKAARAVAARQAQESAEPQPVAADLVETVMTEFIERHAKPKTRDWRETQRLLERNIVAAWRSRRLSEITKADIALVFDSMLDRGASVSVNRLFAQLRKMCSWAVERGLIYHSPCDGIKKPSSEGHPRERVLDDRELALIWRASSAIGFPFGAMTRLLILTGQRRGEVAGMCYSELDMDKAVWTLPGARTKNHRLHAVPLSAQALSVLATLPRIVGSDFVFSTTGNSAPSGFSKWKQRLDAGILKVDERPIPAWTVHDLRRSVATGMARHGVALHVIERVLNHVSGSFGGIVSVYQKHEYSAEMRAALDLWAVHIENITNRTKHNV
jgi:integrase